MAIGWLAVLQAVPWGQVIDNAPKIVNGAKKLWSSVSRNPAPEEMQASPFNEATGQDEVSEMLRQRFINIEKSTAELHEQMVTSTALIKELAEQNTQLIRHIEANRVRTFRLAVLAIVAILIAAASLVLVLLASPA